jgi:hypothetical protein
VYATLPVAGGRVYIPEGHVNGQYFEPSSAADWLRCGRIEISPGEFLYVTLLESYYAHHIMMVTRQAVLPEHSRLFALGDWIEVPAYMMPFTPLVDRRARSNFVTKMVAFADRYTGDDPRDYYAKCAQLNAAGMDKMSYSEMRACGVLAHTLHSEQLGKGTSMFRLFTYVLYQIICFPLSPTASLTALLTYTNAFKCSVAPPYTVVPQTFDARYASESAWVSRQHVLPVDLFSSANHSPLGCYALVNFLFGAWVVPKVVLTHFIERVLGIVTWHDLVHFVRGFYHALEATPSRVMLSSFILWLGYLGLFNVPYKLKPPLVHAFRVAKMEVFGFFSMTAYSDYSLYHLVAAVFGAGDQHLIGVPGYSWFYQCFLSWYCFSTVFPALYDSFWWRPGNLFHTVYALYTDDYHFSGFSRFTLTLFTLFFLIGVVSYYATLALPAGRVMLMNPWTRGYVVRSWQWYFALISFVMAVPMIALVGLLFSAGLAVSRLGASYFAPRQVPLLLPLQNPNFRALGTYGTFVNPPNPPVVVAAPPPPFIQAIAIPPHPVPIAAQPHAGMTNHQMFMQTGEVPGTINHPYRAWFLNTTQMDFQTIVNRLAVMPPVVNLLDVNYACFWVALSGIYGVPIDILAATFLASLHSDDIMPHNHIGLVSPQQMLLAARFYHVGLNIHQGGGVAAVPADLFGTVVAVEGFPTLNLTVNVTQTQVPGAPGAPPIALFHVTNVNPAAAGANPPFVPVPAGAPRPGPQPTLIGFTARRLLPAFFMYSLCSFPIAFGDNYTALLNPGTANECSADYHQRRGGGVPLAALPFVPLPRVGLVASEFSYSTSRPVAKALASDLRSSRQVWLTGDSDATLPSQLLGCVKYADDRTVRLTTFLGVPGSGKTTAARAYFTANGISPLDVSWTFPSALVASDSLSTGVGPLGPGVLSSQYSEGYEIFRKPALRVLVIDDFTRFPPGTLDVLLYFNPAIEHVILTGDPAQSHTAFPTPNSETRSYESFGSSIVRLFPTANYATISYRLAPRVAEVLGLHSEAMHEGDILVTSQPPEGLPLFVTSPRFAETKTAGGTPTFVTSQSQGLDLAGDYCLDLGGMSSTMQNGPVLVGLTRGQGNVFLSIDAAALAPKVGSFSCSSILSAIAAVSARSRVSLIDVQTDQHRLIARSVVEHIRSSVPSMRAQAPVIPLIGAADGLPSLQGAPLGMDAIRRGLGFMADAVPRVTRLPDAGAVVRDVPVPTTIPDPMLEFAQPDAPHGLDAEFRYAGAISVQKPQFRHPGANVHKRADHATMQRSLDKRIHVASPERNRAGFSTASTSSRFTSLRQGFLRVFPAFGCKRDFSSLVDQCGDEVFASWTSKRTLKAIQRKICKEAVDWDIGFTRLFLKSQVADSFRPAFSLV